MPPNTPDASNFTDLERLFALAEAGGPNAAKAARRAAALAETRDPMRARHALTLAAKLEPLDPAPRLALARLKAEAGETAAARSEAEAILADAIDQAARARAAFMLGELARVENDRAAARAAYHTTLQIEDALLAANRSDAAAARWYARARGRLADLDLAEGQPARARTGAEGALALLRASAAQTGEPPVLAADIADAEQRLGALDLDAGDAPAARRRFGEAIGRYEALMLTEPNEPHWRAVLADTWALAAEADLARDAHSQARAAMDKALALRVKLANAFASERWALAATWRLRAALLAAIGDAKGAADSLAQGRTLGEHFCAERPGDEAPARFLVHTTLDEADHALRTGNIARAKDAADAARVRAEAFARADGASSIWLGEVGACWDRLGEVARQAKANSIDAFARAAEFRRLARDAAPDDAAHQQRLSAALIKYGCAALDLGEPNTARRVLEEAANLRLAFAEAHPGDAAAAYDLAIALDHLGYAAQAQGDRETARHVWEDELALAERLFPEEYDSEGQRFRAVIEAHLAGLGGVHAQDYRANALRRLDTLAKDGALTERDAALRKRLWRP
ncbi:exonuclease SbcC [alpha proteobacterium U9-1i]|nr:exonuclease SbcC [alpha proteobacterium U9-1i]